MHSYKPKTMSFFDDNGNTITPDSPRKNRRRSLSNFWPTTTPLIDVAFAAMHLHSLSSPKSRPGIDLTRLLTDELLLKIFVKVPESHRNHNSLVCKRWLKLQSRLVRSLKVLDWEFVVSRQLVSRYPNLTSVDLTRACLVSPPNSGILLNHRVVSLLIDSALLPNWCECDDVLLSVENIDKGLIEIASGYPNLRKLAVTNASELGLLSVANECLTLQELELHKCNDNVLRGIAACSNLQILKLYGTVDGFYSSSVTDIGLTILAQGCERLVKLELSGCEGSFDGIKAIGQCCKMLEELTISDHRMDSGWLAALSYCENLKKLKIVCCKQIDPCPGLDMYLGSCPALERLMLQKCQLRDKNSIGALFTVCKSVKEVIFQDCWGLTDEIFSLASAFRRVKLLSLERCSLLTTEGLESVIQSWQELERLEVVSCKKIKDSEISQALSILFSALKELTWRPDTVSQLASSLEEAGMRKRGRKFFNKT